MTADNRVQFDEETSFTVPRPAARPGNAMLAHAGAAVNSGQARIGLALLACIFIGGAFYFLTSALTPPPELGSDVPSRGEKIPNNRIL